MSMKVRGLLVLASTLPVKRISSIVHLEQLLKSRTYSYLSCNQQVLTNTSFLSRRMQYVSRRTLLTSGNTGGSEFVSKGHGSTCADDLIDNEEHEYNDGNETGASDGMQGNTTNSTSEEKGFEQYTLNKAILMRKIKQAVRYTFEDKDKLDTHYKKRLAKTIIYLKEEKGLSRQVIEKLLFREPKLCSMSFEKIRTGLELLEDELELDERVSGRMFSLCPGIAFLKRAEIRERITSFTRLNMVPLLSLQKIRYMVHKCPHLLVKKEYSKEFPAKLVNLTKHGLNKQELHQMVIRYPKVFLQSLGATQQKIEFLTKKLNARFNLILKFPRYLDCSLERLKERHAFLREEGFLDIHTRIGEKQLRAMVLTTEEDFVLRVAASRMKHYRAFQERFRMQGDNYVCRRDSMDRLRDAAFDENFGKEAEANDDDDYGADNEVEDDKDYEDSQGNSGKYEGSEGKSERYAGSQENSARHVGSQVNSGRYAGSQGNSGRFAGSQGKSERYAGSQGNRERYAGSQGNRERHAGSQGNSERYAGSFQKKKRWNEDQGDWVTTRPERQ